MHWSLRKAYDFGQQRQQHLQYIFFFHEQIMLIYEAYFTAQKVAQKNN